MKNNLNFVHNFESYSYIEAQQLNVKIKTLEVLYENTEIFIKDYLKGESDKQMQEIDHEKYTEEELQIVTQGISYYYGITVETKDTLSHYMIVAAFSYYEKSFKNILSLSKLFSDVEIRKCYKDKEATKILKKRFNIDYNSLQDYSKIQELRILNNDIKHEGKVSSDLSLINSRWKAGDEIDNNIYNDFVRLKEAPFNLLEDLADKLKPFVK